MTNIKKYFLSAVGPLRGGGGKPQAKTLKMKKIQPENWGKIKKKLSKFFQAILRLKSVMNH